MEIQLLSFTAKILASNFVNPKILLQNPKLLVNLPVVSLQTSLKVLGYNAQADETIQRLTMVMLTSSY